MFEAILAALFAANATLKQWDNMLGVSMHEQALPSCGLIR